MPASATAAPEEIDALADVYRFRQPAEVRVFLAANPDLLDLVAEAAAKIPEFLPIDVAIALEVLWDPDDEDGKGQLYVVVSTGRTPDEIRPRMERLDHEWLIAAFRRAGDRFNVDVEYH